MGVNKSGLTWDGCHADTCSNLQVTISFIPRTLKVLGKDLACKRVADSISLRPVTKHGAHGNPELPCFHMAFKNKICAERRHTRRSAPDQDQHHV